MTRAVVVPKETADSVIKELLARNLIRKDLKIKKSGDSIIVPVDETVLAPKYKTVDVEFESRNMGENPVAAINKRLRSAGIKARVPEKWIRYGDAVVFRKFRGCWNRPVLREISKGLKARKVYIITGHIAGQMREPEIRLAYGRHGSITHVENGIRYVFDPEKIMFSPGNVNERTDMRNIRIEGGIVFDMFSGIGYFSLPLAKYSGCSEVVCTDINPLSIKFLKKSARINGLSHKIRSVNMDCRDVSLKEKATLIVMGNFDSFLYIDHAISNLMDGGYLLIHFLLSTEMLKDVNSFIQRKFSIYNTRVEIKQVHIVKSYSPNHWHMSSLLRVYKNTK
ncbi:MAG: class I SAM-dependent methyltransferase [Thermoplasmata archaeon]